MHIFRRSIFLLVVGLVSLVVIQHAGSGGHPPLQPDVASANPPEPSRQTTVKLLVVIYDPIIDSSNKRLSEHMNWHNPEEHTEQLIVDLAAVSHGEVNYEMIGQPILRDEWPIHVDNQRYTDSTFLADWSNGGTLGRYDASGNHIPGDYDAMIHDNDIDEKVNAGLIDEVWLWGFPGAGWGEAAMAGPGAFNVNGPVLPTSNTPDWSTSKAFVLMGLNYERGLAEALESYGHRAESILKKVYGGWDSTILARHDWERFVALDRDNTGVAGLGNAHSAFNGRVPADDFGYDRSSMVFADTTADLWENFPDLSGNPSPYNCMQWQCNGYEYLKWWYEHMPHVDGTKWVEYYPSPSQLPTSILNNWWRYIADPNAFKTNATFASRLAMDAQYDTLTEGNAANWQCTSNAPTACGAEDDATERVVGSSSIKFSLGDDPNLELLQASFSIDASPNTSWDLSDDTMLALEVLVETSDEFFGYLSPRIYLRDADGDEIKFSGNYAFDEAVGDWTSYTIPLAGGMSGYGGSEWIRDDIGTPSLANIVQIEIEMDNYGGYGFDVYFDGLGFASPVRDEVVPPAVSITAPSAGASLSGAFTTSVAATDNHAVLFVDLFIDGTYYGTDAIAPYTFALNQIWSGESTHMVEAVAVDLWNNSESAVITIYGPDNCPGVSNPLQENADADFTELSPLADDLTWPRSDLLGNACDLDDDNDGFLDTKETSGPPCASASAATNPLKLDTDGDRFADAAECLLSANPASAASKPTLAQCQYVTGGPGADSDGDGVQSAIEFCRFNTQTNNADTDADGCPDGREIASVNGDRVVDASDVSQVGAATGNAPGPPYNVYFDMNRDGSINVVDLSFVNARTGVCPPVP